MKKHATILLIFLTLFGLLYSREPFRIIRTFENEESLLTLIEDLSGKQFILKQIMNEDSSEQLLLLVDLCASQIGIACQIPVNKVSLIPANTKFPGKTLCHLPATLHEVVPGIAVEDQLPWEDFSVHQRFHRPIEFERIWGALPPGRKGLTDEVLNHMKKHSDLIKIVAFDTFVGNGDRSNPNLFYDKVSNQFWGIDMAASFHSPLAKIVKEKMRNTHHFVLPQLFLQTLEELHLKFPTKMVAHLLMNYVLQSKYFHQHDQDA